MSRTLLDYSTRFAGWNTQRTAGSRWHLHARFADLRTVRQTTVIAHGIFLPTRSFISLTAETDAVSARWKRGFLEDCHATVRRSVGEAAYRDRGSRHGLFVRH